MKGLSRWHSGKESAWQCRRHRLISGSGRCPRGGNGNPFQYSCLESPMDRGAWQVTVHEVAKSQTQLKWRSTCIFRNYCQFKRFCFFKKLPYANGQYIGLAKKFIEVFHKLYGKTHMNFLANPIISCSGEDNLHWLTVICYIGCQRSAIPSAKTYPKLR